MHIFKKEEKTEKNASITDEKNINATSMKEATIPKKVKKKKIRISLRATKKQEKDNIASEKEYTGEKETTLSPIENYQFENEKKVDYRNVNGLDDYVSLNDVAPATTKEEDAQIKKKKTYLPTNVKGKPVYLEDTGEKLGTVFDIIYDGDHHLLGYKIKDDKSDTVLSFPFNQFDEDRNGLIFVPKWYTKAVKTLEKFEFKDRISPEITTLLMDDAVSNEELYNIFIEHDDEMAKYMDEALALKELLINRLKILEKQRMALKDSLMDLTEKRLIKDIDRRQFSEDVMEHRRKVNILDVNIQKCKELLKRLDQTSFGVLGKQILAKTEIDDKQQRKNFDSMNEKSKSVYTDDIELPYKKKYFDLKERFEQLEENYNELKIAVEKLINKTDS